MEKTQNTRIKNTNISSEWKLQPRCMVGTRSPAYVNTGHISPCCWVDGISTQKEDGYKALFTNDMKLENLNSVDEVFSSEAWIDFFLMLKKLLFDYDYNQMKKYFFLNRLFLNFF